MASKRRGTGEGAIYRETRTNPRTKVETTYWVATIEAGRHPVTGKRLRRKVKARTKIELTGTKDRPGKIAKARSEMEAGIGAGGRSTRLGDFLDWWLDTVVENRVTSDNTLASYRGIVDQHLRPGLGTTPVAKLTPEQVDRFLAARAKAGLSASYVRRMRMLLADALRHAERRGIAGRNVATLAVMPKCAPTVERRSFTPDEARSLITAAGEERLGALVVCGVMLGLRPGELTGLLWTDLDIDTNPPTLSITGSMKRRPDSSLYRGPVKKSKAGERTLALPAMLAAALVEHRRRQAAERLAIADLWIDHRLIFPSELGTPLDAANVRRTFARVAKRAGIDSTNAPPYLMRHTAASLLVDNGATIEEVADLLGDHPETLHRHYRHRVRPVADAAAERMEQLFGGTG